MDKSLILITGSVMNSSLESVNLYNELVSMIDLNKYQVSSPLDTMKFNGTDRERYDRAIDMLNNTLLMIAEMSNVSTGQGMEIERAASLGIPILVIARDGSRISGLVRGCPAVKKIIFYNDIKDIKEEIDKFIEGEMNEKHSNNRR